jgi:AAA15 family ATPase/GTPase
MIIKKLIIKNFKKFDVNTKPFEFNDDINILVGDNECGKSTILEAIDMCLNLCYRGRPVLSELTTDFFNGKCVKEYLLGHKSADSLPEIRIEAFIDGYPELKGKNNSLKEDTQGMFVRIFFDPSRSGAYADFIADPANVTTLPVEFYKVEWFAFSWDPMTHSSNRMNCLFIDPSRLHPTYGRSRYINTVLNSSLNKAERAKLNLNFRQLKATFDGDPQVVKINNELDADKSITNGALRITTDTSTINTWESNLHLTVDSISLNHIGKGEQNKIQIKLSLKNKAGDMHVVMIEEPENHLSHMNLVELIKYIETKNQGKQIFITTHSSYVLNKLSINKLCLLSNGYVQLKSLDKDVVRLVKRLPGYDTLRVVLAKKVILVEGPSDELLIKKIFLSRYDCLPEDKCIDVIVVRGLGFSTYLEIGKELKHLVRVVRDNDGDFEQNIAVWKADYKDHPSIEFYSPTDNKQSSLEPALIYENSSDLNQLDKLAKTCLSTKTFNNYKKVASLADRQKFLLDWFTGSDKGARKVDAAIRIFDTPEAINYPEYLKKAAAFD